MKAANQDLELNYLRFLPANRDARVLDVGCGPGRVLRFLADQGFTSLYGVDRDPGCVAEAGRQVPGADVAVVTDLRGYLAKNEGRFDLVIAKDVIYYFPGPEALDYLKALLRVLKPGGMLITENFNGAAVSGNFIGQKDRWIEWIPNEFNLRALLGEAGFEIQELFPLRPPNQGLRRRVFNAAAAVWRRALGLIYVLERGLDPQNPTILTTKLVAVATRRR